MPIRKQDRFLYPVDWPQLSDLVRFRRAGGRCETCGRPHGQTVRHLGDGRWWDEAEAVWRSGQGRRLPRLGGRACDGLPVRTTRVALATVHLDRDPSNNRLSNLKALCQRCHMLLVRPPACARSRAVVVRDFALGDLFLGPYPL